MVRRLVLSVLLPLAPAWTAADEAGVRSPFVELGFDKAAIRETSRRLGLPTADKPELACLASRFPTGTPISVIGLERVGIWRSGHAIR